MRVLLLSSQPERTTRLQMFKGSLEELGYDVIVPKFRTRNWIKIAGFAEQLIKKEKPDVVHVFNVPDVIYSRLPELKGKFFKKMIYDYRSPWGLELQMNTGLAGKIVAEHFERKLTVNADLITTVNKPLGEKVQTYLGNLQTELYEIPNYPWKSFVNSVKHNLKEDEAITFLGRICEREGIKSLLNIAKKFQEEKFRIVGDGPFAKWYLAKKPKNVEYLGWQPHENIPGIIQNAKICMIPFQESILTTYTTDKSVWKLNEYLNFGKLVIASGISKEEDRKNLLIVNSSELENVISEYLDKNPEKLNPEDYRFWESNTMRIKEIYEKIQ
ncbi:MAG: glycosyl transferase family 1 [Euryarchaeota archaeon]|nr:glycosyl transferase family 1 [Euryarchaeota archaeon]